MARNIVITGGSRGIGAEIVCAFAKTKDNIIFSYNTHEDQALEVKEKASKLGANNVVFFKVDVCKQDQVDNFIKKAIEIFGRIDVLVCSAGISGYNLLIDSSSSEIENIINTNLLGVIYACQSVSKNMLYNQKGKIINISSMWGVVGASNETIYSASKAGVIGFSKALAKELGSNGVSVNVVAPGVILTDMTKNLDKETLDSLKDQTALGRIGTPQDVAGVVEFLASDKANYITGQVINVDGGFVI